MTKWIPVAAMALCACSPGGTELADRSPAAIVARLDSVRYRAAIRALADFGDRLQGTQRNLDALDWLEAELRGFGYTNVVRHGYLFQNEPRHSIYATKVGSRRPWEMYIVSAHMDGRGGGEAADDDASGCAVILELARVLGSPNIETDRSVRFIFWNNEESGLNGSRAYASGRALLQGVESPSGSGEYPEPVWLGVIQHDMMLFDHGLPLGPEQSPSADIDIEYQVNSLEAAASAGLAEALRAANITYSSHHPAEIGSNMNNTDSRSFQDFVASVSLRENRRVAEIGAGSNPHWHQPTDLFSAYTDADFRLGFNAAQTTLGALITLVGARVTR